VKQIRKRLTYANVMSSIAVFLILGGATALAASQLGKNTVGSKQLKANSVTAGKIKNGAVTPSKISVAAQNALKGATGPAGSQGPKGAAGANGAPGSALAYAHVDATEPPTADPERSKGITTANLSDFGTGGTCISGLSFTPHNVVATLSNFDVGEITADVAPNVGACPADTQIRVTTYNSSGTVANGLDFQILVN
jgi:hypothetical protein